MPTLPTLTVTDAQAQRMLGAFGSADNYKAWLKTQIIEYVIDKEEQADHTAYAVQAKAKSDATRAELS